MVARKMVAMLLIGRKTKTLLLSKLSKTYLFVAISIIIKIRILRREMKMNHIVEHFLLLVLYMGID